MENLIGKLLSKTKDRVVDYSIEYAHIYSDDKFGKEQVESIEKTKKIIKDLKKRKKTFSVVVLIDDYHPDKNNFDKEKFINNLKKAGLAPDYIAFESKLVDYKDDILNLLSYRNAKKLNKYLQKREKLSCSFLIAGWYLLRLGLLPFKNKTAENIAEEEKPIRAKEIINVLDKKYAQSEDNVRMIIRKSVFRDRIEKIKTDLI